MLRELDTFIESRYLPSRYGSGVEIVSLGTETSTFTLIRAGVVREEVSDAKGHSEILGYYPRGFLLGSEAMLTSATYGVSATRRLVAATDTTVIRIGAIDLLTALPGNAHLGLELNRYQAFLREIGAEHEAIRRPELIRTRTARALVILSIVFNSPEIPIREQELAEYTRSAQGTTSTGISKLVKDSLLTREGKLRRIIILNMEELAKIGEVNLEQIRKKFTFPMV